MKAGQAMEADLGKLSAVIVTDDGVGDSQAMDISHNTFQPLGTGIVSDYHACVSHQLGWRTYNITQFNKRIRSQTQVSISLVSNAFSLDLNPITSPHKYSIFMDIIF